MKIQIKSKCSTDYFYIRTDGQTGANPEEAKQFTISSITRQKSNLYRKKRKRNGKIDF